MATTGTTAGGSTTGGTGGGASRRVVKVTGLGSIGTTNTGAAVRKLRRGAKTQNNVGYVGLKRKSEKRLNLP